MSNELEILTARYRELGIDRQIDYGKFCLYSIITHSTAIEGSTITELENQILFDQGISLRGKSMAASHTPVTVDMLVELASFVIKNMSYNKVPGKLSELCDRINAARQKSSAMNLQEQYEMTFDAHYALVTIHPWADGNGRTARLLMNQLQMEMGLIPAKILKGDKEEYIKALVETREKEDPSIFRRWMTGLMIRNLRHDIDTYLQSVNDEKGGEKTTKSREKSSSPRRPHRHHPESRGKTPGTPESRRKAPARRTRQRRPLDGSGLENRQRPPRPLSQYTMVCTVAHVNHKTLVINIFR